MSHALLQQDANNRLRALANESFIVEAPAGAGKTELLTQRMLTLLANAHEPEEVVALTFTNKAAAEMRSRIISALQRAQTGMAPVAAHQRITFDLALRVLATDAAQGWNILQQPARLRVMTLDALNAHLTRQMPFLSRFGGNPRLVKDALPHFEEAARRTLELLEAGGSMGESVAQALLHVDNNTERLQNLLVTMLARRDQWMPHIASGKMRAEADDALYRLLQRELQWALAAFDADIQRQLIPLLQSAAEKAAEAEAEDTAITLLRQRHTPLTDNPQDLPLWQALCRVLLTKEGAWRQRLTQREGFASGPKTKPIKDAVLAILQTLPESVAQRMARVQDLPEATIADTEWQVLSAISGVLELAAAQLWTVFLEAGVVDFIEVAQRALHALGSAEAPTDLTLALDYRIRHLLIDEFQDTSPLQIQLLARLMAGWTGEDGRTLFAVGDPMQSIYRFRKADVGLFLAVQQTGIGSLTLQKLSLLRNNRADPQLVSWVNHAFAQVLPAADNIASGAIRYREFAAAREALPGAGVRVHAWVLPHPARTIDANELEAQKLVDIIRAELTEDHARQVALLVRSRSHLNSFLSLLHREHPDLNYQAVELEGLQDRQVVQDLLTLVHALCHRADRLHWLALLRAPWCGLTLSDLHYLAADAPYASIFALMQDSVRISRLSTDGQARLAHVRSILEPALQEHGRQGARAWVEGVWLSLGGAACLSDETDIEAVHTLFEVIDTLDAAEQFSPAQLTREIATLSVSGGSTARLQIMTIHRAKGLEFDTVIVPGLGRKPKADTAPLMLWEEIVEDTNSTDSRLLAAVMPARIEKDEKYKRLYDYLRQLEGERNTHEAARLLYVAATRAKYRVHWVGCLVADQDGKCSPSAGSLLNLLWPVLAADFNQAMMSALPEYSLSQVTTSMPLQRVATVALPEILHSHKPQLAPPVVSPERHAQVRLQLATENERAAMETGTLVHSMLEIIAGDGLLHWPIARLADLYVPMQRYLQQRGLSQELVQAGAQMAQAMLTATLSSSDGQWVLKAHPEAVSELALNSGRGHFRIDRTFVCEGYRWIIDYKSDAYAASLNDDIALNAYATRWREQLENYEALFADKGLPIRLGVLLTRSGRLLTLK